MRRLAAAALAAMALMPTTLAAQVDGNDRLERVDSTDHVGAPAREPMVVRHPGGALFVSGYGGAFRGYRGADTLAPRLWSSVDEGRTWARVDVGGPEDGAVGNSDVDLAVAPDGTLYFVTLRFDRERREGVHVAMGVSRDGGGSWAWTLLDRARFDDRPWIEVAPDGTAHALWSSGAGILHSASTDRGVTWSEPTRVHPGGGSSHLAVGPRGELGVRITPRSAAGLKTEEGVDFVAVSTDGGRTWQKHPPPVSVPWPVQPSGSAPPRWVEPLAWDAEGALYALWSEADAMRLGRSADRGATWTIWTVARSDVPVFYPYLVSRNRAELAATWMSWLGDAEIRGHVAHIVLTEEGPRVATADFPLRSWVVAADGRRWPDTAGEYMGVTFLPDGSLGVVAPIQDPTADAFGFTWRRFLRR